MNNLRELLFGEVQLQELRIELNEEARADVDLELVEKIILGYFLSEVF